MSRDYYQYFSYLNGRTVFLSHHSAKDVKVSDLAPLTITATVTAQPPDYDRTARILAAAERLYQSTKAYVNGYGGESYVLESLADYANTKEQK